MPGARPTPFFVLTFLSCQYFSSLLLNFCTSTGSTASPASLSLLAVVPVPAPTLVPAGEGAAEAPAPASTSPFHLPARQPVRL